MSKPLALLFAFISILFLVLVGVALSYQNLWLALLFLALFFLQVAAGFVIKAKIKKEQESK